MSELIEKILQNRIAILLGYEAQDTALFRKVLEVLEWNHNTDLDNIPACEQWAKMLNETIAAVRERLGEE